MAAKRPIPATPAALVTYGRRSGLSAEVARLLDQAGVYLDRRDAAGAAPLIAGALALAQDHPEVLRLAAVAAVLEGRPGDAVAMLRRALATRPDDALLHNNLGSALAAAGDTGGAIEAFRRACAIEPALAAAWYNLGKTLKARGESADADAALTRALALAPGHVQARIVHGDNLKALGRIDEAESAYRAAIARDALAAHAWWGLANLKTVRFDAADVAALESAFAGYRGHDRPALGFALAKALEDQDRYADAFAVLDVANALRRAQQPWDAARFGREVDAIVATFEALPPPAPDAFGSEVIFIVSLPRAGSTLVEQILAAHPEVEGAGELPDLSIVLDEESRRRGAPFAAWAREAGATDWRRLGERYLERTARWRAARPRFTDKSLLNVPYVGAAAAMLPGARFVHCRRDPVETALSCWRQWFAQGQAWTYAFDDIAACSRGHERLMALWQARMPRALHTIVHEALVADPEASVRALLDACGLAFDARCLDFHRSPRSVRTASAAQVRQPLRQDTGRAARYGALLDPLRRALASS
jgi:tetratricopeptide (TPR) repeat protein